VLVVSVKLNFSDDAVIMAVRRGVITGVSTLILVLLYLLMDATYSKGYSHEATYAVQPVFAHRNIAIEGCMLWFYWLMQGSAIRKWNWVYFLGAGLLAFIFQARSAMLMWAIMLALEHKKLFVRGHITTRIIMIGIILFSVTQIVISVLPANVYKPFFDTLPDNLKALDVSYNLNEARSSSDRIELWQWTYENLNFWGHGLGQWRADAQGEVNQRIGRCDLFIRHAHSDLLEYSYELGLIPVVILVVFLLYLGWSQLKVILVFLPLLLFSFPTERPEIMMVLGLSILLSQKSSDMNMGYKMPRLWCAVFSGFILVGVSTWAYSQHLFGRFFHKSIDISKLNTAQQLVVAAYPQDLLNNSLALFQAHYLIAHNNVETAIEILEERLRVNSNDLGVQKQLLQLKPNSEWVGVNCVENLK
jgi:hypothetical protein